MGLQKTLVVNTTSMDIDFQRSNLGIGRSLRTLYPPGSKKGKNTFTVEQDPNGTYCEYLMLLLPHENQITLSSDDLNEFQTITIEYDENKALDKRLQWVGTSRNRFEEKNKTPPASNPSFSAHSASTPSASTLSAAIQPEAGVFSSLKAFLGFGRPKLKVSHDVTYIDPASAKTNSAPDSTGGATGGATGGVTGGITPGQP